MHSVSLSIDAVTAFEAFTERISDWWPEAYTPDPDAFDEIAIEPEVGGRVVLRMSGGSEYQIGEVTAWDPGRTYAQTWTLAQDPDVPSSLPGGPSRIWVVAASGTSFRSPRTSWSFAACLAKSRARLPATAAAASAA